MDELQCIIDKVQLDSLSFDEIEKGFWFFDPSETIGVTVPFLINIIKKIAEYSESIVVFPKLSASTKGNWKKTMYVGCYIPIGMFNLPTCLVYLPHKILNPTGEKTIWELLHQNKF